jgi:hypothetical protein
MNAVELHPQHDGRFGKPASFTQDAGALRRRVHRFRQAGLLEQSEGFTIEQAATYDDLRQAYALVHDVFLHQGYIAPQPGGLRIRPFEATPELGTLVAKAQGQVVAVMSVASDSPDLGLPSDKAFNVELNHLRDQGRALAETTNLAVAPDHRNSAVFFELSRACVAFAMNAGLDDSFISISPGHSMFFEAILGFEPWGDRRDYGDGKPDYVEGMRLNLRTFKQRVLELDQLLGPEAFLHHWFFTSNPHFEAIRLSVARARRNFLDPALLRQLFVEDTGYLLTCPPATRAAIERRWGSDLFAQVMRVRATKLTAA